MTAERTTILVVDDEETNIDLLLHALEADYDVSVAMDGQDALATVAVNPPHMVLLDVMMPGLDGFQVCEQLKNNPASREIPVVFITGRADRQDVLRGLALGARYYITKPFDRHRLLAIVATVAAEGRRYRMLQEALGQRVPVMLAEGRFLFRTLEEVYNLVPLLVPMCPMAVGCFIGLTELMVNAVEHGNLGLTYADKSRLQQTGQWQEEIDHRLGLPAYADCYATLQISRTRDEMRFLIRDQGQGFDWRPFLELAPDRAFDSHGRGIAMARSSGFRDLFFQGVGNEVVAVAVLRTEKFIIQRDV